MSYKKDLKKRNLRTTPLLCSACRERPGIVWRRSGILCYDCDAASRPVVLDGETIAAALMVDAPGQPVVNAKAAIEALQRSQGRKRG